MSSNSSRCVDSKKSIESNQHKTDIQQRVSKIMLNSNIFPAYILYVLIGFLFFLLVLRNNYYIDISRFNDINEIMMWILFIYVLFVVYFFYLFFYKESPSPKKSVLENAYSLLLKAKKNKVLDEDVISLVYNRIIVSSDGSTKMSLLEFLESFQIYVLGRDNGGTMTKEINDIVKPILYREKEQKPYSNVNETERNILIEIENCINRGDTGSIKNRLEALSSHIIGNYSALKKAEKTNNWSVPTSIFGILLTVGFGLWSILGSHLSKDEIEQISQKVSQQMSQQNPKQERTIVFDSIDCVKPKDSIQ